MLITVEDDCTVIRPEVPDMKGRYATLNSTASGHIVCFHQDKRVLEQVLYPSKTGYEEHVREWVKDGIAPDIT
jgi:hypothetical protein